MTSINGEIRLFKDGNKYCALLGSDLQAGISAFGHSTLSALVLLEKLIDIAEKENTNEKRG